MRLITLLNFIPHIICITETRIKDHSLINVSIPNYSFVHVNSTLNAGGVAVYLHSSFKYKPYEQQFSLSNSECMWIKVRSPFSKLVLGVVYRHPSFATVDKFVDEFSNVLDVLSTRNELHYILGDFNINVAQNQTSGIFNNFLYTLISNGAIPLITKATRITDRSSTIIGHIITIDTKHRITPEVLEICLEMSVTIILYSVKLTNLH